MKAKIFLVLVLLSLILTVNTQTVFAQEKASASSAKILIVENEAVTDYRIKTLKHFFDQQNSPLAPFAGDFIRNADKYNLDWKLVAAISGVESTFGQAIPTNSYNAWGWGVYGDNVIRFGSWTEGIDTISQGLRERYMNQWGGQDIYQIGKMYASSPAWAGHVTNVMNQIQDFAMRNPKDTLLLSL